MKKLLFGILTLVIALVMVNSATASDNTLPLLSELSDEDCLLFLEENGIEMPSAFSNEGTWLQFVRQIISKVEGDPNTIIPYNSFAMFWCTSDIKDAVNAYYGVSGIATYATSTSNILQDNTVHGTWSDEYELFTSYTYAIDYYVPFESEFGELMWYDPGKIWWNLKGNEPDDYNFNRAGNVETIVDLVELDLCELGYTVISASTTMPNTNVDDHTKLICVRRDDDGLPPYENRSVETEDDRWHDYHFMKLGEDGNWYHKPTITNPLKYNHVPTYDRIWVFESAKGNPFLYKRDPEHTYDSEIWFIEYTTPHVWEYVFWESGKHIERCTICGEEQLGDCQWASPAYVGLNSHQFTCELCGGLGGNTECTLGYINYYFPESTMVHQIACTVCGHAYGERQTCTYEISDNGDGTHTEECTVCGDTNVHSADYQHTYTGDGTTHTHTKECSMCDYSIVESCTFAYMYYGPVDGNNTHIYACSTCGYVKSGPTQCVYLLDNQCSYCHSIKDVVMVTSTEDDPTTD